MGLGTNSLHHFDLCILTSGLHRRAYNDALSSDMDADGGGVSRYRMALDELQAGSRKLSVMDPVLAEWETKASRGKPVSTSGGVF